MKYLNRNIILLSREMPSLSVKGGIAVFYFHLLPATEEFNTTIITSHQSDALNISNGKIVKLPSEYIKRKLTFLAKILQPFKMIYFRLAAAYICFREVIVNDFTIIESPECGADSVFILLLKLLYSRKIKLCVRIHGPTGWDRAAGTISLSSTRGISKLYYYLERLIIRNADLVTVPSSSMVDLVHRNYFVIPTVVLNPYNIEFIDREITRKSNAKLNDNFAGINHNRIIVFLGTWEAAKGSFDFERIANFLGSEYVPFVIGNDPSGNCPFKRMTLEYIDLLAILKELKPIIFLGAANESFGYAFIDAVYAGCKILAKRNSAYLELSSLLKVQNLVFYSDIKELEAIDISGIKCSTFDSSVLDGVDYLEKIVE